MLFDYGENRDAVSDNCSPELAQTPCLHPIKKKCRWSGYRYNVQRKKLGGRTGPDIIFTLGRRYGTGLSAINIVIVARITIFTATAIIYLDGGISAMGPQRVL